MSPEIRAVRTRINAAVLLGIVILSRPGCASFDGESGPLAPGTWGGNHLSIEITDTVARAEYDCATGTITTPIILVEGEFTAAGTFTQEHGGPVREGELSTPVPARYAGTVSGDRMVVTVYLPDEKRTVGTFELVRGGNARVFKCL
jgi:hypothetical protein